MHKTRTLLFSLMSVPSLTMVSTPEPRIMRNEYTAQFPNPIRLKIEAGDLKHLEHLSKINPTVTIQYKSDPIATSSPMMTAPYDLVGALGLLATVLCCDFSAPCDVLLKGTLSVLSPLFPRFYNYLTSPQLAPSQNNNENKE